MDEYDPRRLPGFNEGRFELSAEDLAAFAAAHPEIVLGDLQLLKSASRNTPLARDEVAIDP